MAEGRWGYPVSTGDIMPVTAEALNGAAVRITDDGTRRILPGQVIDEGHSIRAFSVNTVAGTAFVVTERLDGLVLSTSQAAYTFPPRRPGEPGPGSGGSNIYRTEDYERGLWLEYPDDAGYCPPSYVPVTPGSDYYTFRRILGEHAHRFQVEHNPATLRFTDETQHRIEHIAHELTDDNRNRAGNVSAWTRSLIGTLWVRIHEFRGMAITNPASWRAERDRIAALMELFCDVCDGAGMSHRTIRKHPVDDWRLWLDSGVRFSTDRGFNSAPILGGRLVTEDVMSTDILNYTQAMSYWAEGREDDDYLAPGSAVHPTPQSALLPLQTTGDVMFKSALAARWRQSYDGIKLWASFTGSASRRQIAANYRLWCVLQLLVGLNDVNYRSDSVVPAALRANMRLQHGLGLGRYRTLLARMFAGADPWLGTFPQGFQALQPDDRFLREGTATIIESTADASSLMWDPARRLIRFTEIDAILGDATTQTVSS